jgi:hypothetical protein
MSSCLALSEIEERPTYDAGEHKQTSVDGFDVRADARWFNGKRNLIKLAIPSARDSFSGNRSRYRTTSRLLQVRKKKDDVDTTHSSRALILLILTFRPFVRSCMYEWPQVYRTTGLQIPVKILIHLSNLLFTGFQPKPAEVTTSWPDDVSPLFRAWR